MATRHEARSRAQLGFLIHLAAYVLVNAGLAALDLMRSPHDIWFPWVLGGWGIGLAVHGALLLWPTARERMIDSEQASLERHARR